MKRKIAMLMVAMATSAALATSYNWTGGGADATLWNDEDNWSPVGVPGGGDTATFTSAATIADGIAVASGELKIVASGAAVTLDGVISGAGSMYFQCTDNANSKIFIAGANTYSGGTTINAYTREVANNPSSYPQIHGIYLKNATALGATRSIAHNGGTILFDCASTTFNYDFTPAVRAVAYAAAKTCTIGGTITDDTFASQMYFVTRTSSATLTVTGKVGGSKASTINLRASGNGQKIFLNGGAVTSKGIEHQAGGDGWSYGTTCLGGQVKAASFKLAYGIFHLLGGCVIDGAPVLDFSGYTDGEKAQLNLNGSCQTVDRLTSVYTASSSNSRRVDSTAPATLIVRPSQSSLDNCAAVNGAVSVVLDAQEASYIQQFSNRVSSTSGSLIASNGILRIGCKATFANVPRLVAANTGAIEVADDVARGALVGVREIVVEGNGRVTLPASVLTANNFAVTLSETALLEITDGTMLEVSSLKIGNNYVTPGRHPDGSFTQITGADVAVPVPVSPDSTGVWTGAGATESTYDPDNWEGGVPGTIPVTFATGGTRAQLAGNLIVSDVRFDTPAETPTFTVEAGSATPEAKVYVSGGIAMTNTAHASGHTNVITAPVVFAGSKGTIDVEGAANGLVLGGPLMQQGSTVALTRKGSGVLHLTDTNSTLAGSITLKAGKTYIKGGALGGTPTARVTVRAEVIPDNLFNIGCYLTGGTYNQNFIFKRSGNNSLTVKFMEGTTNVVNGYLEMQNNYTMYFDFGAGSRTVINGGYNQSWVWGFSLFSRLYGGAELEIREKPLNVTAESPGDTRFFAYSSGTGKNAHLVFATTGNYSRDGLYLAGPLHVDMDVDFAFNTNSAGIATAFSFLKTPTLDNDDYVKPTVFNLNGHDQRLGSLATVPASSSEGAWLNSWGVSPYSYFTSETPATLYVLQNGRTNAVSRPWPCTFRGAMSLVKEGTNTLALSGASSMAGRLEVANGRLEFKNSGSMTNVSEFAVSGGVLAIDSSSRLPRRADCRLSGGKLDLAEGVMVNVHMLYVPDGADGWTEMPVGVYSAANLPTYISGAGSLRVRGDGIGTLLILR